MKVQFTSKTLIIMIIIPIVVAIFSTGKMVNMLATASKYEKVVGTVVGIEQKELSSSEKSSTTNFIKYNYEINGKVYETESKSRIFISKKVGDTRGLYVNPQNPSEVIFAQDIIDYGITIIIGIAISFVFFVFYIFML